MPSLATEILSNACDDFTGLYEVLWTLNRIHPDVPEDTKLAAAQHVVLTLLKLHFIQMYETTWQTPRYTPLLEAQADVVIRDPRSWNPPPQEGLGLYYCCTATREGERAYYAGNVQIR